MIKGIFCWVVMIACVLMAFASKNESNSELFASLAIIAGTFSLKVLSTPKEVTNE